MTKIFEFNEGKDQDLQALETAEQVLSGAISVDSLPSEYDINAFQGGGLASQYRLFTGEKFAGGFGETVHYETDYWLLRERSSQIFKENIYARGIIRRLINNEINTGLTLVAEPAADILGLSQESAADWSEEVEQRFHIYQETPVACDHLKACTFGKLQKIVRREALIEGDMLVVLHTDKDTTLPKVQLIRGCFVQDPSMRQNDVIIKEGVEVDKSGRHVAYWVEQEGELEAKRIPAFSKSGRRVAWLVYGTDLRHGETRGEPLLSVILQSLKEIDRYRDSAQRKAVINSLLAMYIMKTEKGAGSKPMTGGAVRHKTAAIQQSGGESRDLNFNSFLPGITLDELSYGEEPKAFKSDGTDVNFPEFEAAIVCAIAWANEMPPEILMLKFSSNYSASQAAINEFKLYLNAIRKDFSQQFCIPVYQDWLAGMIVTGKINADGFIEAMDNPAGFETKYAWLMSDWTGAIKPSADIVKQTVGMKNMVDEGWTTNERAARELTGTKFSRNIQRQIRENKQKAEAARPLLELKKEMGIEKGTEVDKKMNDAILALITAVDDLKDVSQ